MTELSTLGGEQSAAYAINADGQIAGEAQAEDDVWHACLWEADTPATPPLDLDTLDSMSSRASALTDKVGRTGVTTVVGVRTDAIGNLRAFEWDSDTQQMRELLTLRGAMSGACGINNDGIIVGWAQAADESFRAVLWADDGILDLNTIIPPTRDLMLEAAMAITDDGVITGYARENGAVEAFMLALPDDFLTQLTPNEVPGATDDIYATTEGRDLVVAAPGVFENDTVDPDGPRVAAEQVDGPANGVLEYLRADGSFKYTPNAGFTGADAFRYRNNDGIDTSGPATVTINVTAEAEVVFDLTLNDDWTLFSIPITPLDDSVAAVLQGMQEGTVWELNADGSAYVAATRIVPTRAYWAKRSGGEVIVQVRGHALLQGVRHVTPGIVMFGPVAPAPDYAPAKPDWMANPDGKCTPPAYGYRDGDYYPARDLESGSGYFLNIRVETDLDVDSYE